MYLQLIQLTDRSQGMPDAHAAHELTVEAKGFLMHMQLIQLTDRSQVMPDAHAAHPAHY